MANDIVADFLRRLRELDPDKTPAQCLRLERELRRDWGGERVYVVKASPELKAPCLAESLAAGRSLSEAAREMGVHRVTCWRWRRRGWVGAF
jgi:DNA-binding transcriptional regulator LsrR (DeoR family)